MSDRAEQAELSPIRRLDDALSRFSSIATCGVLVLLVLDVLWGVGTRFLLGDQARWTEEAARLLLVWASLLGGAMAYSFDAHLGLDVFVTKLEPSVARICDRFVALCVYVFAVSVMVIGGGLLFGERIAFGQTMPSLGISRSWLYLAIPVSGVLIAVSATRRLLEPDARGPAHQDTGA